MGGAICGAFGGQWLGLISWVLYAKIGYGEVNYNNTFEDYTMLTGNVVSLVMGGLICYVWSMISPENYDFESMKHIKMIDDEDAGGHHGSHGRGPQLCAQVGRPAGLHPHPCLAPSRPAGWSVQRRLLLLLGHPLHDLGHCSHLHRHLHAHHRVTRDPDEHPGSHDGQGRLSTPFRHLRSSPQGHRYAPAEGWGRHSP